MTPSAEPRLTALGARRWLLNVRGGLRRAAPALDAVNVFPVADGDTGTNMFLTVDAGLRNAPAWDPRDVHASIDGLARSVLWSARGNSGVILAQLVAGAAQEVVRGAAGDATGGLDGAGLARALERADASAWQAVASPASGTILSVSRAATGAARTRADAGGQLADVARSAFHAAVVALARTPEELPALARAQVVDAGAAGYVVALRHLVITCAGEAPDVAALQWLEGEGALPHPVAGPSEPRPLPGGDVPVLHPLHTGEDEPEGHGDTVSDSTLEVVLGLTLSESSAKRSDRLVKRLRKRLTDLGDSVVVAGAGRHWRVHVHVVDARAASKVTALCRRAGDVAEVRTESLDGAHDTRREVALLVAASGRGLVEVLRAAGAHVVESSPGHRVGIGELVEGALACRASRVVFLPADEHLALTAQEAARQVAHRGVWLQVVDARSLQAAVSAVAVWDPGADVEKAVRTLTTAAGSTHDGAVRALPGGGFAAVVGGQEVGREEELTQAVAEVMAGLPTRGVELATVIVGEGQDPQVGKVVEASLRLRRRAVEVQVIEGGPEVFPVLVGLE